ncbi:DUF1540 domain-containing protein [Xylanimonas ulmi]|uniref:Uncharacterized protein DUF1540 n=1 Tax=Xylanimonas ulmi TaxID=228973 RepID=A0A4Q7LZU9_9MICO|nr:DUF1540 domain-containing protein [Xylanibacterium ulmi]RZS60123.1 uncharacterized protein DUF1540 [Xylanibacterium ulmi]
MTTLQEMPSVAECTVAGCGFNHDSGCHAAAVTIGGAACATFIPLDAKGGLASVLAHVGACQRLECRFNDNLECSAEAIRVGAGSSDATADCLTFAV